MSVTIVRYRVLQKDQYSGHKLIENEVLSKEIKQMETTVSPNPWRGSEGCRLLTAVSAVTALMQQAS